MTTQQYLENINKRYKLGNSTEHTFRGDLQQLLESLVPGISATNEPKRQKCGAPDYILLKNDIPLGFIEAKDIDDDDLKGEKKNGNKEQFDRYKGSLSNLMFTDYLDFHYYIDGQFKTSIRIGEIKNGQIVTLPLNFQTFENLIKNFCIHVSQTITNPKKLAEMMAARARLLANVIEKALTTDEDDEQNSSIIQQMAAFKEILIHDIKPKKFADIYAQTITYGMFAARVHDPTIPNFNRQEAAELIPRSNPFLRRLFSYIAGPDIDFRIKWIVDSLADVFLACNLAEILKDFGQSTKMEDPIIHFYETFLTAYDKATKIEYGVWYTPQPVVHFIVQAIDHVLKTEFSLARGLADNSKTKIKINLQETDKRYKGNIKTVEEEVHKVQILDPATGTGTFLAEVVKQIHSNFLGQEGIWSSYVENHLIPRLNGFELLMASYAMAHLQLDLLLTEKGFVSTKQQRLRIYLTDSLEESHQDTGTLFTSWLSDEANEANFIKRDTPVMCVLGNPPYLGESKNKGEWILKLMQDYKKEPGGLIKLKERNSKGINADENKFIRYGQYYIERNGSGILAYINPHTFLDSPICRGMRWHLLKTFDKIYTIDLHGNGTKQETSPDGSADVNVFDIMQGVSINIFIKTGEKKANELGKVFHFDLYGKREAKYDFLSTTNFKDVSYKEIQPVAPYYYFVPIRKKEKKGYHKGFSIKELMAFKTSGVKTHDDPNLVASTVEKLEANITGLNAIFDLKKVHKYFYRPFDTEHIYYDVKLLGRAREKTIFHLLKENLALILVPQPEAANIDKFDCIFISDCLTDTNMFRRGGPYAFPVYLYPKPDGQHTIDQRAIRVPNFNKEIIEEISSTMDLLFSPEQKKGHFCPIDLIDYIYAVLHSPKYRSKYKEFLQKDFPLIPYPKSGKIFWELTKVGAKLRDLHLLKSPVLEKYITKYPVTGSNLVDKIEFKEDKVFINKSQFFDNIPKKLWLFSIGGYLPAQKWLKDRKDLLLSFDEILYYQKIIAGLAETDRLMSEIDNVEFF